jgi:two-component system, NtrC family, sensor histidine kinase PilS
MVPQDELSRSLWLIALYRIFVAFFLLWLVTLAPGNPGFTPAAPIPYLWASAGYAFLAVVLAILARHARRGGQRRLIIRSVGGTLVDIVAVSMILLAAGGVETGLGLLLIPPVAANATITSGRTSLFMAALATLAVLSTELVVGPILPWWLEPDPTQTGLLGQSSSSLYS